jgi:hypothetical protein
MLIAAETRSMRLTHVTRMIAWVVMKLRHAIPCAIVSATFALISLAAADLTVRQHGESVACFTFADGGDPDWQHVIFSPDGATLLVVSGENRFRLIPAVDVFQPDRVAAAPLHHGRALLFLPDGGLVVTDKNESRIVLANGKTQKTIPFPIHANPLVSVDLVALSETMLIGGSGDYWDGSPGNLLRHDLSSGTITKGAEIRAFAQARLSPDRRWIAYEFGDEETNHTHLYDLQTNSDVATLSIIGKGAEVLQMPLGWTQDGRFLVELEIGGPVDPERSLALIDPRTRKLLWQQPVSFGLFPSEFIPLDASHALLIDSESSSIHTLDLRDGTLGRLDKGGAKAASPSPDRQRIAILDWPGRTDDDGPRDATLTLARPDGTDAAVIARLPAFKSKPVYKGMGIAPPLWSARGDLIVVPTRKGAWCIRTEKSR